MANDAAPIQMGGYEAGPGDVGRVLLLYSGGLDTSVMCKWIQDHYGAEVVALTLNIGQPGEDYDMVRAKALDLGALACEIIDAREEFARDYVLPAIKANALYGGGYPLFTALGRPLIAKIAVEKAREHGCDAIAHGCTGKGNDQVRFDSAVLAYAPDMKIVAPVRHWQMGREEEIAYAREHGIPVKGGTEAPPYSIDDNIWGRSSEGGPIEDLSEPPRDDVFELVADPTEDRIVGLKVRDLYEVPAAAIVLTAHKELEKLVGTIHQNNFKPSLDQHWAYLVYAGLWYEPLLSDLNALMDAVNEQVTGEITMRLYKGSARPVARRSPNSLYDADLAGFGESGGLFSQQASPGFIELWSLPSRMAYNVRNRGKET